MKVTYESRLERCHFLRVHIQFFVQHMSFVNFMCMIMRVRIHSIQHCKLLTLTPNFRKISFPNAMRNVLFSNNGFTCNGNLVSSSSHVVVISLTIVVECGSNTGTSVVSLFDQLQERQLYHCLINVNKNIR